MDLMSLMAEERSLIIDWEGFDLSKQRAQVHTHTLIHGTIEQFCQFSISLSLAVVSEGKLGLCYTLTVVLWKNYMG